MFDAGLIRAGMRVIGSNGAMIGVVRRIGVDRMTVAAATAGGPSRDIPLSRVARVDRCVHLASAGRAAAPRHIAAWGFGIAGLAAALLAWNGVAPDDEPATSPGRHMSPAAPTKSAASPAGARDVTIRDIRAYLASSARTPRAFPLDRLRFASGSAAVSAADEAALAGLAAVLRAHPEAHARIVAYPAADGRAGDAAGLAQRRAIAVLSMLGANGVAPGHLEAGSGAQGASSGGQGRPLELVIVEK